MPRGPACLRSGSARRKTRLTAVVRKAEGKMRVGFIGLGMMGKGMAANLQKAGHQLVVHDLNRAAAEPFLAKGAQWASSPRALAEASEAVFTSLPVPADVEAVALGPNGLIEGMKPDTAFFDMSTNSVTVVRKIHAARFRAPAAAQGRVASGGAGSRGRGADAARQSGAGGTDRGSEPRLGPARQPRGRAVAGRAGEDRSAPGRSGQDRGGAGQRQL